jgi:hypothetical protein
MRSRSPLALSAIAVLALGLAPGVSPDVSGRVPASQARPATVRTVALVTSPALTGPALHGLTKLREALAARGLQVSSDMAQVSRADVVVLAGLSTDRGSAATLLASMNEGLPSGSEALAIRPGARYQGRPAVVLVGADSPGLMYAALDTADRVSWTTAGADPFQFVRRVHEHPYLQERGVVIFTMQRGYFESRLHDANYWVRYFDMLAADRINELTLTFGYEDGGYMAPPYPYFFDVKGFPDVKVIGLTAAEQTANREALTTMIRLAKARGIRVKPGIWDHIYRGGGQRGGITGAADGRTATPGLVWGLDARNLVPFTVAALKQFYDAFPDVQITQFRMHTESGLLQSEIEPFWHDVFSFYRTSEPDMQLELRVKELPKSVIRDAQAQGLHIVLDTKVWMEQGGLPFHPTKVNPANQRDARHSYADLLEYPQTYRLNWTLWNGGSTRVLLWADPAYARRMVESARLYDGQSLSVTEMEATKMLGEPHASAPRDVLNPKYRYFDYEFERYWAFYRTWGRLAYDPAASADVWEHEYARRVGAAAAPHVMRAIELASQVMPRIVAASYPYRFFPTTTGWPEMMHAGSLPQYAREEEGSDVAQFMNVRDEAASILEGTDTAMRRPEDTSRWFARTSDAILAEVATAERTAGSGAGNEFKSSMTDARMLAALARYHAARELGGVNYNLYRQAGDPGAFDAAIENERQAVQAWHDLVTAAGDVYSDDLAFGAAARGFPRHWKDELARLEREFAQLQAERQSATPRADAQAARIPTRPAEGPVPVVVLRPASPAVPGQDLVVRASVSSPAGVRWIHLRYRHLNQHEDYESVDMTRDAASGLYTARIPADFIDPHWDLMYYVEIVDANGTGRIYPDLDIETPYVVVGVRR